MNLSRLQELSGLMVPVQVQEVKDDAPAPKTADFHSILDFVNDSLADLNDSLGADGTLSKLAKGAKMAAISKAFAAFKKDIEGKLTDIEVDLMAAEADGVKEGKQATGKSLTEAKDYDDSGDFTDDLFSVSDHINKVKQSIRQPRWSNWMQVTDDNFGTSCVALNADVVAKVKELDTAFDALENELHSAS